jgi:hypothetical protein
MTPTSAKDVTVVASPFGRVVVSKTRREIFPPPGVNVVMNVDPAASVAVTTCPDFTLERTTVLPLASVVVTVVAFVGLASNVAAGAVVTFPSDVTMAPATVDDDTTVEPAEFVVVAATTTDTDAEVTTALVAIVVLEPAEFVVATLTGTTTAGAVVVEVDAGGGAAAVVVVVAVEVVVPFA